EGPCQRMGWGRAAGWESAPRPADEVLLAQQGVEEVVHPPAAELEVAAQPALPLEAALLQHPLRAEVLDRAAGLHPLEQGVVEEVVEEDRQRLAHYAAVLEDGR